MIRMTLPARRQSPRSTPRLEPLEVRALPSGNLTRFPLPNTGGALHDFIKGPDGTFWFLQDKSIPTEDGPSTNIATLLGKISPLGKMTLFPIQGSPQIGGFTPLADGTLWFGGFESPSDYFMGEITPANAIRVFHVAPDFTGLPISRYAVGTADDLWFVAAGNLHGAVPASQARIVRMTPQGAIQAFPVPAALPGGQQAQTVVNKSDVLRAPDGSYWFEETINGTSTAQDAFVRISPNGQAREFLVPAAYIPEISGGDPFAFSRDGSVWFSAGIGVESNGSFTTGIVRLFPNGRFAVAATAPVRSFVGEPVADSEGNVWFATGAQNRVGSTLFMTIDRASAAGRLDAFAVPEGPLAPFPEVLILSPGPDGSMYVVADSQVVERISRSGQVSYIGVNGLASPGHPITQYDSVFSTSLNQYGGDFVPLTESSGSVFVASNGDLWFVATTDGIITRFRPTGAPHR